MFMISTKELTEDLFNLPFSIIDFI